MVPAFNLKTYATQGKKKKKNPGLQMNICNNELGSCIYT